MPANNLMARACRALALLVLPVALTLGVATSASARTSTTSLGSRAVKLAAAEHGKPYLWGAAGPRAFDCSGLVQWVYAHLGVRLPHNAELQFRDTAHLRGYQVNPGDLVFFHSGSYVYHVGIYAGNHMMWAAPHTGSHVMLERIWSASIWFGRPR